LVVLLMCLESGTIRQRNEYENYISYPENSNGTTVFFVGG